MNTKNRIVNCPACNAKISVSRFQAELNYDASCSNCFTSWIPYINKETDTIEILEDGKHFSGENNAMCRCPACNAKISVSRFQAEHNFDASCSNCFTSWISYINKETDTIEILEDGKHFSGENNAMCRCPACNAKISVSRFQAENNYDASCTNCFTSWVPYIDEETDTIRLLDDRVHSKKLKR